MYFFFLRGQMLGRFPDTLIVQKEKADTIISTSKKSKLELKIMREDIVNYLGIHIHLYKNVKTRCLCAACIGQALLSMQKMYYNI